MPVEIERKFLLNDDSWRQSVERSQTMAQGYIAGSERGSVRVRISGGEARLNIKSATIGVERLEYEYAIPLVEAQEMLERLCGSVVQKTRHYLPMEGLLWEIDEFAGLNAGLIVAEIELPTVDTSHPTPGWLGQEVSGDIRYYNNQLAETPYCEWAESE